MKNVTEKNIDIPIFLFVKKKRSQKRKLKTESECPDRLRKDRTLKGDRQTDRRHSQAMCPTDPLTTLKLQNTSRDVPELNKTRQSPYQEAHKL